MPLYEYVCRDCGEVFALRLHIDEHEQTQPECSKCSSSELDQLYSSFFAKTAKKS